MFGWLAGAGNLISKGMGGLGAGLKKFGAGLSQPGQAGGAGDVGATSPGAMPTASLPGAAGGAGAAPSDPSAAPVNPDSVRGRLQQFGAGLGNMQQLGGYGGGSGGANFGAGFLGGFSGARGKRQDLMKRRPGLNPNATPGAASDEDEEELMRSSNPASSAIGIGRWV